MHEGMTYNRKEVEEQQREQGPAQRVVIRPFTHSTADYAAAVAVENAVYPETPDSIESWRHFDSTRDPHFRYQRFVGELRNDVVAVAAFGEASWAHQPGKFFIHVDVHPRWQRRGIGSRMYRFLRTELEPFEPSKLVSWTKENQKGGLRFLRKRGFRQIFREPVSRLDSSAFDVADFLPRLDRVARDGIKITTLQELSATDPDWKRKLYELEWECLQDVPTPDPFTKRPFDQFEKRTLGAPTLLPEAWFVAVDGDDYVGLSVLWRNLADDHLLETGLTGVIRSYRRRGVATAMKVRAIQYAQTHGEAIIETDNHEDNPMFQLNLQLGFVPQPAHLGFEKLLAADRVAE
jgi:GNAT superfamily N-acetyltransferase